MSTTADQSLIERLNYAVKLSEQLRVSVETWAAANEQRHTENKGLSYELHPSLQIPN